MRSILVQKGDGSHDIRDSSGDLREDKKRCTANRETYITSSEDSQKLEILKKRLDMALKG